MSSPSAIFFYVLSVQSSGIALSFGINNAPLVGLDSGDTLSVSRPVQEWVMPKGNRLTGLLYLPPGGAQAGQSAKINAVLQLVDVDGAPLANTLPLARFTWPDPAIPALYPFPVSIPFAVPAATPAQLWQQAEPIEKLTPQDEEAMLRLVETVRTALVAKDHAKAFEAVRYKYEDDARVNGTSFDKLRAAILVQFSFLDQLVAHSRPLTAVDASFDLIADKRVVLVTRRGTPAIQFEDESRHAMINVYCARIQGEWRIVR